MGYPIEMIDKETLLFALVGENAIESKRDSLFNDCFKADDTNAKMMPLNIRMDDIGFFIYGFKDSKIKAGYFQEEYWEKLYELLDQMSPEAKLCGIVDTIDVKKGQNIAYLSQGKAAISLLKPKDHIVGIYGQTPSIKSILFHLVQEAPKEIILYAQTVEDTLVLMEMIPSSIKVDVIRITEPIMIEKCTIMIDAQLDQKLHYHDSIKVLELGYHDSPYLTLLDVEKEIAKIKTKEWIENG